MLTNTIYVFNKQTVEKLYMTHGGRYRQHTKKMSRAIDNIVKN